MLLEGEAHANSKREIHRIEYGKDTSFVRGLWHLPWNQPTRVLGVASPIALQPHCWNEPQIVKWTQQWFAKLRFASSTQPAYPHPIDLRPMNSAWRTTSLVSVLISHCPCDSAIFWSALSAWYSSPANWRSRIASGDTSVLRCSMNSNLPSLHRFIVLRRREKMKTKHRIRLSLLFIECETEIDLIGSTRHATQQTYPNQENRGERNVLAQSTALSGRLVVCDL